MEDKIYEIYTKERDRDDFEVKHITSLREGLQDFFDYRCDVISINIEGIIITICNNEYGTTFLEEIHKEDVFGTRVAVIRGKLG